MYRCVLVLLIINSSYRSLGNPINSTAPDSYANVNSMTIKDLTALADQCKSEFLSTQIKNKLHACSTLSLPRSEKQLQCLIFYDINMQLCAAICDTKMLLPEKDYSTKINEVQDVNSLCLVAKDWVFSDLPELPHYKETVERVFKNYLTCGKICSVDDFTKDEANYFCKYFEWGTEKLRQQITISSTQQNPTTNAKLPLKTANDENNIAHDSSQSDLNDLQIKNNSSTNTKLNTPTSNNGASKNNEVPKDDLVATSTLAENKKNPSGESGSISNVVAVPQTQVGPDSNVNVEDTGAMPENEVSNPSKSPENVAPIADTVQGPVSQAEPLEQPDPQKKLLDAHKIDVDQELPLLNSDLENKQPVLETPKGKQPSEVEDYPDSEEGKDGFSDMQGGDDGDDTIIGGPDTKIEETKPAKKTATVVETFTGEKETFFANPIQDAFPEEEDHFFPFFLSAVILVAVLYILYHNKNKVSKVFFGLLVEGRQATRRRNSRGHSYRRLDTLEQAMGANTTAPPSKIIY